MVRRFMASRDIELPMRDILMEPDAREELVAGGGRQTVPCLRIEREDGRVEWMYESRDIIAFLDQQLGAA